MQFKRSEGFRFEFKTPLKGSFKIIKNEISGTAMPIHQCLIHDISPRGMKMFSVADFGEHSNKMLQIEIQFILDEVSISAIGDVVWTKPYANGRLHGIVFTDQPQLEDIIISELKARRRKELAQG